MHAPQLPDRRIDEYATIVGSAQIERLRSLADRLTDCRVLHINSTVTGGGVAELLRSIIPLANDLGVATDWLVMDATDAFFDVTKAMHNGLQGSGSPLTDEMKAVYRSVNEQNVATLEGRYDIVIVHDPQPLGMVAGLRARMPDAQVFWRCHIDLTEPDQAYSAFIKPLLADIDRAIYSRSAYAEAFDLPVPTSIIHPAIDPLTEKNRSLDSATVATECDRLDPLTFEAPVIAQVSRFDPWKDQFGTLDAYRLCRETIPNLQLVLAGGMAGDDPEGLEMYERIAAEAVEDADVHVLTDLPDTRINVLQRRSDVVIQKSLREGFGLVVSEALWKQTPVVGSNVGGIPLQIQHGRNGYIVEPDDTHDLSDRVVTLLRDPDLRHAFGNRAREHVRQGFLLPRQLDDLLTLCAESRHR